MDVKILVRRIVLGWIILAFIVGAFGRVSVAATNGGRTAADFLLIGAGARAAGMGGAFSAVSEGASASYWNPAGLTGIEQGEVMLGHFAWFQDVTLEFGAFAYKLNDRATMSASITYLNYGTIEGYDIDGNPTADISAYDLAAAVSFGYLAREDLSAGLTAKPLTGILKNFTIPARCLTFMFPISGGRAEPHRQDLILRWRLPRSIFPTYLKLLPVR